MSGWGWVLLGLAAWVVLSPVFGVLVGKIIASDGCTDPHLAERHPTSSEEES